MKHDEDANRPREDEPLQNARGGEGQRRWEYFELPPPRTFPRTLQARDIERFFDLPQEPLNDDGTPRDT